MLLQINIIWILGHDLCIVGIDATHVYIVYIAAVHGVHGVHIEITGRFPGFRQHAEEHVAARYVQISAGKGCRNFIALVLLMLRPICQNE